MQYRRFGKTELQLSVFSLGTMRYLASAEVAIATVQRAVEIGINHIETAKGYGQSEVFLGQALQQLAIPRTQLHITTKLAPTLEGAVVLRQIDDSLQKLGIEYLDCLAVHGLNTWEHLEWVQADRSWMQAVRQVMAEGKVRHLGFSTHGPLELIRAAIETELFEFVNLHYYYFFQRHATILDLAAHQDLGIFIISPADKGGMLYRPPALLQQLCDPYAPLELTYRFLLQDPRITTLSLGAACPEELSAALQLGDRTMPLAEEEQQALQRLTRHQPQALGAEQCRQCYQCLPCPEQIHIPEVLRLRNLAVAYDMTEFGQYRYQMFENAGHWFPGMKASRCTECGDCLPRCPEQLNIPALLQDTHTRLAGKAGRRLWED